MLQCPDPQTWLRSFGGKDEVNLIQTSKNCKHVVFLKNCMLWFDFYSDSECISSLTFTNWCFCIIRRDKVRQINSTKHYHTCENFIFNAIKAKTFGVLDNVSWLFSMSIDSMIMAEKIESVNGAAVETQNSKNDLSKKRKNSLVVCTP